MPGRRPSRSSGSPSASRARTLSGPSGYDAALVRRGALRTSVLAAAAAALIVLAGCGGGDDNSSSSVTSANINLGGGNEGGKPAKPAEGGESGKPPKSTKPAQTGNGGQAQGGGLTPAQAKKAAQTA